MYFEKKIDSRSKEAVAKFLVDHYRYNTLSSLNRATSYAHCVKVNSLGLTGTILEKAYDLISVEGYWNEISGPIREFEKEHMDAYTIGNNGRCGGYLVLYESEVYDPGYKSTCSCCGQLNYQPVSEASNRCGVCGHPRKNLKSALRWTRVKGSSIDHGMTMQDFMDMSFTELKDRAELVRSFDNACDRIRAKFIASADQYFVVEETVMVPTTIRRLERV